MSDLCILQMGKLRPLWGGTAGSFFGRQAGAQNILLDLQSYAFRCGGPGKAPTGWFLDGVEAKEAKWTPIWAAWATIPASSSPTQAPAQPLRPSPSPGLDSALAPYCPWGRVPAPHPGIRGTFTAQFQPFLPPPPPTPRGHRAGMHPCTPHPHPTSPLNATYPRSLPLLPHLLWLLCPGIALMVTHPPTHTPSLFGMNS